MNQKLLLLFTLLFFSNAIMAQDPELINNEWFLEKVVISGTEVFPPVNEELPNVPLFFEDSAGLGVVFWSFVCNALNGIPTFDGTNSFIFTELSQTLGNCYDPTNSPFESQYFQFYFSNEISEPYIYEITDEGDGKRSMTITVQNGDIAYYQNALLGIEDNSFTAIKIFPNPASNQLNINASQPLERIEMYSVSGKFIMSETDFSNPIDISKLPSGLYFIKISSKNGILTKKFIKN